MSAQAQVSATIFANATRAFSRPLLDLDPVEFTQKFNRKVLELRHSLASEGLFQLPALMELADRTLKTRPKDLHYDAGAVQVEQRWDEVPHARFSPQEAMRRIQHSGAWFIFKAAQIDPEYKPFLERGLAEIKVLIGPKINSEIFVEDLLIFVTSPNRVSSYHIDRECNFLLQVHGNKTIYVFDRDDRDVLPEEEIERFWSVDHNAARYKPNLQGRSTPYRLTPGTGVHLPVNSPHWVKNDDNVSVSLSMNFQFKDVVLANAYRANFLLRRFGLKPTPPGKSPAVDTMKSYAVVPGVWARKAYKRISES
ncbi:MAG: hypothetical protein NVS9B4_17930 [Candidatus Acidiferrum sp.]